MGALSYLFYPWGLIVQGIAVVHFLKRRPENYWLFVIIFGGMLGAVVYVVVEMIPDLGLLPGTFHRFGRRSRISVLETQVLDNPSAGNLEELAELYFEQRKYEQARDRLNRAIAARGDSLHAFYLRARSALGMGDYPGAIPDLEYVVGKDPKFDHYRATGLLGDAYARTGDLDRAAMSFALAVQYSTTPETLYNYANYLKLIGKVGGKEADAAEVHAAGRETVVSEGKSVAERTGGITVSDKYRSGFPLSENSV
jgi:hypothetical protein